MFKIVTLILFSGSVLLLVVAIILVYLNFNQEVIAKMFAGILVGALTVVISVYMSLKETNIVKSFVTSIVVDEQEHLPVDDGLLTYESNIAKGTSSRISEVYSLSRPWVREGKKPETRFIVKRPNNFDETVVFLQELFQYKLVCDIPTAQFSGIAIGHIVAKDGNSPAKRSNYVKQNDPYNLGDLEIFEGNKVLEIFSENQFAKSFGESMRWGEHCVRHLLLPKGTKLSTQYEPSSGKTGVGKHKVFLVKPNYFKVEIAIELFKHFDIGEMPKGIVVSEELAKRSKVYYFKITMNANFDRITSGNPKTVQYQKWVEWLFEELKRINSDS